MSLLLSSAVAVALNPESVKAFLASIASALAATKTWLELRDRAAAKNAATVAESVALSDPETERRAKALLKIVPQETLKKLMDRYQKCFDKFNKMLDQEEDKFFADDIDKAAKNALPNCICQALSTIKAVAGGLPDTILDEAWATYQCEVRLNENDD